MVRRWNHYAMHRKHFQRGPIDVASEISIPHSSCWGLVLGKVTGDSEMHALGAVIGNKWSEKPT